MDNYLKLINKYGFTFIKDIKNFKNYEIIQTGIGDLLLASLIIKNGIVSKVFFNISIYVDNVYSFENIYDKFYFKIKLINDIFNKEDIIFYYDKKVKYTEWHNKTNKIQKFDLLNNCFKFERKLNEKYIVFHTKCRFMKGFNYDELKNNLNFFFKNYDSNYTIVLLGEREFPETFEKNIHGICTIYNELLELKNNNKVIDLTIQNIYNNLDYENYKKDLAIIANAELNIGVGHGGQFVNSIVFGKKTSFFLHEKLLKQFRINNSIENKKFIFFNYNNFFFELNKYSKQIKYNIINDNNINLLSKFIEQDDSKSFRYFEKRNIDIIKNHLITLIVTLNNNIAGYGHLDLDGCIWLGICVLKEYRGQGLGNKIMKYLVNYAKNNKIRKIYLTVDKDNKIAVGLYEKCGFIKVDDKDYYVKMCLELYLN